MTHPSRLVWKLVVAAAGTAALISMPKVAAAQAPLSHCEDARIVARVGSEVILASEVISLFVRDALEKLDEPIPQDQREKLIESRLRYHVELKLLLLDAKRTLPEEALPKIKENIGKHFDENEIPAMMKITKSGSRQQLEEKLQRLGSSLHRQKLAFIERALAMQWLRQKVESSEPITHERMLEYYQEHLADYEHPAQARWEELFVKVDEPSDRRQAYERIVRMGNAVQDGAAFAEIAKNGSDGVTAAQGGMRDWTSQSSLVSETIDGAIFSLPVGCLSPIMQSRRGFHIVRVIQRREAYRTSFKEAQSEIREMLKNKQSSQERKQYLAKLKDSAKIWTVFDETDESLLQASHRGAHRYDGLQSRQR